MNNAEAAGNNTIDLTEFKPRCLEIVEHLAAPGVISPKKGGPLPASLR